MDDPHRLRPDHAPTPFSAEEIRQGCPPGRTVTTETVTPAGQVELSVSRFRECDVEGATFESGGQTRRLSWVDLQSHASFPASVTTIDDVTIEIPIGRLDCLRYTVTGEDEVYTFWFAKDLPGMPVRHMTEIDGAVTSISTVVANEVT